MGNLSEIVGDDSPVVKAIYAHHKARVDAEPVRGYLGASILGHECDRYLWLTFRGASAFRPDGRLARLLETGDLAEARFVAELRAIGCTVETGPGPSEQFEVSAHGGHLSGHMDGVALGVPEAPKTWHVCEFKTHNAKSFEKLKKDGVQRSKPTHYAQMQVYMRLGGLERALYLAVNKNTDELYSERVSLECGVADDLIARARRIISASTAPDRIANRPDDWRCKLCDARDVCWGADEGACVPLASLTCRACCHSTADTEEGGWTCARYKCRVEDTTQGAECPEHLLLPSLLPWAEVEDAGDDWIDLKTDSGTIFRHGAGGYSSRQLVTGMGPLTDTFEPTSPAPAGDLLDAYPWGDSEVLWSGPAADLPAALEEHLKVTMAALNAMEPSGTQSDDRVNAAEYRLRGGDFLVVLYHEDDAAAIWKGKE